MVSDRDDTGTDYGSDIELDGRLLLLLSPTPSSAPPATNFADEFQLQDAGNDGDTAVAIVYPPLPSPSTSSSTSNTQYFSQEPAEDPDSQYFDCTEAPPGTAAPEPSLSLSSPSPDDTRSPYDRFRSQKKSLSVTDLVSNLWCEQQFEYTLLRGFKRETPQMRRGTRVHKVLEEQVHTTVPVEVTTKEDAWGLSMFNMYQGLASLRQSGLTRELRVFGFLDDIFVKGVIDEVSFVPPHTRVKGRTRTAAVEKEFEVDEDGEIVLGKEDTTDAFGVPTTGERIAYLSDTKTRASRSSPTASQVRATTIQLMLYHRLLSQLRSGTVDLGKALKLFELDGGAKFSDGFIAEIAGLDAGLSLEALLEHNSLWGMWELVRRQAEESMDGIGPEMGVSYRSLADGSMIGFKALMHDDETLDAHLAEVMKWWKGERSTVGVDIEEAWKCGSCEFEATCEWRLSKLQEELDGRKSKKRKPSSQKGTARV